MNWRDISVTLPLLKDWTAVDHFRMPCKLNQAECGGEEEGGRRRGREVENICLDMKVGDGYHHTSTRSRHHRVGILVLNKDFVAICLDMDRMLTRRSA